MERVEDVKMQQARRSGPESEASKERERRMEKRRGVALPGKNDIHPVGLTRAGR
jgi:hypothetical protein